MTRALVVLLVSSLAATAAAEEESPEPVRKYLEARKLLYEDDLPSAVELLERVVREHPDSEVADDCLYWSGWCRLRLPEGRPRGVEAFYRLMRRYPESPWLDEAGAAMPEKFRPDPIRLLRERLGDPPSAAAAHRAQDALAAMGDAGVAPLLEKRVAAGDREASGALSRLGETGVAILEPILLDEGRSPDARRAALAGWIRAVTAGVVPTSRAKDVLLEIRDQPVFAEHRRTNVALLIALARERPNAGRAEGRDDEEDLRETVRRLRREVRELREQVDELTRLLDRKEGKAPSPAGDDGKSDR
jgi:hypothetical protein